METRIIVCGGTDFDDYDYFTRKMDMMLKSYGNIKLVSGHAKGADSFVEIYAAEKDIPIQVFPAEWKRYGRTAGPIRNRAMLVYAMEETPAVIAFWNGKSRGSGNMLKLAKDHGVECQILYYGSEGGSVR